MPHLGVQITPLGPVLSVYVSASGPRQQAILKAGGTIPVPVLAHLLVDTGAGLTAIDCAIFTQLGLVPTGTVAIHTPSTNGVPHSVNQYDVTLLIPSNKPGIVAHNINALPVIDGNFKVQGIDGLLGRDVLGETRMIYCGPDSALLMSF